jgi:hypothetical protein
MNVYLALQEQVNGQVRLRRFIYTGANNQCSQPTVGGAWEPQTFRAYEWLYRNGMPIICEGRITHQWFTPIDGQPLFDKPFEVVEC